MQVLIRLFVLVTFSICPLWLSAQDHADSVKSNSKSFQKKALKQGMGYITTHKKDTVVNETSVDVNKIYTGKIIRKIHLEHIDFKRSIYDSTKRTKKMIAEAADLLHGTTKSSIIRQHLFIRKNKPFNPYLLSDNERYIRDLDFILDCRMVVVPISEESDSIDILVITKDVFSLGVRLGGTIPTAPKISVYDANLAGLGQRLDLTGLVDATLDPVFTSAVFYRKSSVFGSLANVEFGYSQLNTGRSYGDELEYSRFIRATRPLVSPYSRLAGGFEFSKNWSHNINQKPDSTFLNYQYNVTDVWIGFNFGVKRKITNRNRVFLATRFMDGVFINQPDQVEYAEELKYNSAGGYLTELTFYRQNFYRTRYLFGFGRTEDVPYGFSLAFSSGYLMQLGVERPYSAVKFAYSVASRKGNIFTFDMQAGTYLRSVNLEDGVVNTMASYITRALNLGSFKMRAYVIGGYAALFNQDVLPFIKINKSELLAFSADSVWGNHKAFVRNEIALYTPWQLLGFRFAPFLGGGVAWLDCLTCPERNAVFYEVTGGVRTRNENLIFGTMEIRFTYIPPTDASPSKFAFGFKQRLAIKKTGSFVRPPSIVKY